MTEPTILFGPPGTGKTTELLNIVDKALSDGVSPDKIGYVAFTKKAATEAAERASERFSLSTKELPFFRTLHSLAFKQLGYRRDETMGARDYFALAKTLGLSLTFKGLAEDGNIVGLSKGDRLFFTENLARVRGISLHEQWSDMPHEFIMYEELEQLEQTLIQYKNEYMKVDYTDMIVDFISQRPTPDLDLLIIDEAQDLTPTQWQMSQLLMRSAKQVYVAGDDDQAIFKWAGADPRTLQKLEGKRRVLNKSYRVPREVAALATSHITLVRERVTKVWTPRDEHGSVQWHGSLDEIDMSEGSWLLLGRNSFILTEYEEHCIERGYVFSSSVNSPINSRALQAIVAWETLRRGSQVRIDQVRAIYEFMSIRLGVKYGFKKRVEEAQDDLMVDIKDLRTGFGLLRTDIWHKALDRIPEKEKQYFINARERGEKLLSKPRININTIHGVKGGEAQNVVVFSDMASRTYQEYLENPDDEIRVWYVALTRAIEKVHIISARSLRAYTL